MKLRRVEPAGKAWRSALAARQKKTPLEVPTAFLIASEDCRSGGVALEPLAKAGLGRASADLHVDGLAALVEDHRRDRPHAVLDGGGRVLVDVELDDLHLALELARELLEYRGNRAARAAPFSPETDEHGLFRRKDFLAEAGVRTMRCHGRFPFGITPSFEVAGV